MCAVSRQTACTQCGERCGLCQCRRAEANALGRGRWTSLPDAWWQLPPEFPTKEVVFDDEGAEYNTPYAQPVRMWRIEYSSKLKVTQAAIRDNFWAEHRGYADPFYFFDEREGVLYDNVRFAKDGYTRDHTKLWRQTRNIQLIRRPI